MGIGSELHGDDIAGVAAIRRLRPLFASRKDVLLVEAGPVPENAAGSLRRFAPQIVILLDAAWFGGARGEIRLLDWHDAQGYSATTHALPLSVFANYLENELHCQVLLLAVQVENVEFDTRASPAVMRSVRSLARGLAELLQARD